MFKGWKKYWLLILTIFLLFLVIFIFYADSRASRGELTFAMLDVGQGDAIFIESPTGTQILFDVGPPRKILGELSRVMPPFDRSIDAVMITNPDQDHIGGFLDILKTYKIGQVFEAGTFNESRTYENLKVEIREKDIKNILAKKGMRLHLGGGAVIDILFPDRDVSDWTTNDGSVVARLTYGETSIMLTGDATSETERIVLENNSKNILDVDILKVGHHGSKTSTSENFVRVLTPEYALISSDGGEKYGHPHKQTLDTLNAFGAKILRTDESGTVVFKCDRIGLCEIKELRR